MDPRTYKQWYREHLRTEGVPFFPDAAWRDALFGVVVVALILILAIVIGPKPLGPQADPTNILTYPRPDWYFVWFFSILAFAAARSRPYLTLDIPTIAGPALEFAETPLSLIAENLVLLRHVEYHGQLHLVLGVLKMRFSDHERGIYEYAINSGRARPAG